MDLAERRKLIDHSHPHISVRRQAELLNLNRSGIYYQPRPMSAHERRVRDLIDEVYTEWPFYGSRKLALEVGERIGKSVNRKLIQRLMREMGIAALAPGPSTSQSNPEHEIYPYLLRNREIIKPNEVWSTDITYVRLAKGFAFLTAVIDWYSRYVLSWKLSNTLDVDGPLQALNEALKKGKPEIFNTDQGSQFTSKIFTSVLKKHEIKISMDGRGRALDNVFIERLWRSVKYEDIYPRGYETMSEANEGLEKYFDFYNNRRPHQALGYKRPVEVHYGIQ